MKAPPFRYARPRTLAAALKLLAEGGESARLLAGGQSLVPALNMRLLEPKLLIDINGLGELSGISETRTGIRVGALTRQAVLGASDIVARRAPLLTAAVPFIAHAAIRNRGTFGGSLAQADPAAELPACAVALEAQLEIAGPRGLRRVPARDFFKGVYETALARDEILVAAEIPAQRGETLFLELARRHGDYAMAGLAGWATVQQGRVTEARLVFFGTDIRAIEAKAASAALATSVEAAIAALDRDLTPVADFNAGAAMKRHLAGALLRRACAAVMVRAA
ncbi:MAG: FAD binding domain-containing protein [Alphaproteobacteria bacterium]|nr:FAD binding domain-containing protein [Alphaproteobacteria bacterium]